jgi:thiol-disulfide isomerase/thioredoxin
MKLATTILLAVMLTFQTASSADETNLFANANLITSTAQQMKALRKEVDDAEATYYQAIADRKPKDQVDQVWKSYRQIDDANYPKIFELARQEPASETACEMFGWIVANRITQGGPLNAIGAQSVGFLRDYHATNPNVARICWELGTRYWNFTFQPATDFLRTAADRNPNREVRGQAVLALARRAKTESWCSIYFSESTPPEDAGFAKAKTAYLERAKNENPESLSREAAKLLNLVLDEYADCPTLLSTNSLPFMATLGEVAQVELYDLNHLSVGKMAPEISGEDLDGHKFKLSDYRGKIVMLSFWASWCGSCMRRMPSEVKLAERMKGRPFALVGVNGDPNRERAMRAVEKEKITWPSFWSTEGRYGPIPTAWNVQSWPTIYLLDPNGVVRFKGEDIELLNQKIDQLLGQFADKTPT